MSKQKFAHKEFTTTKVVNNLIRYYNLATNKELSDGCKWYNEARNFCESLSSAAEIPIYQIAGVVSALSPQTSWDLNKELAFRFLVEGERKNLHNGRQIEKAEYCLQAKNQREIFNLLTKDKVKTSQFYYNMLFPYESIGVTVDRHAIQACIFKPDKIKSKEFKMTKKQYDFFSDCYIKASEKVGLLPHQFQAVVWLVVRRLKELPANYNIVNQNCPF